MTVQRAQLKHYSRQVSRLRWIRKYRNAARREGNAGSLATLSYVLFDPELDTFSYEVANDHELASALVGITGLPTAQILELFAEARRDPVLAARIRRGSRGSLAVKRQPKIGRHLVTYAIVRAIAPPTVLEIGVRFGLGSLVILRALERNRGEGGPSGELVSVDIDPYAGALVDRSTPGWSLVVGPSPEVLADALRPDQQVGLVICDSVPPPAVTTAEVATALEHAAQPLVVMQSGWNMVLPDLSEAVGLEWVRIVEQPVAHIGAGRQAFLARVDDAPTIAEMLEQTRRWPQGMRP